MEVLGGRRRLCEARVVLEQIRRLQEGVRRRRLGDPQPPQLFHQSVLVRPVIPLDAPLGLGRARRDDVNPQRHAHAAKLRQGHGPRGLLLRISS